ncbi:MAG: mechanosensitive ion channel family protein [Candidatus Anstonellales archaeon]
MLLVDFLVSLPGGQVTAAIVLFAILWGVLNILLAAFIALSKKVTERTKTKLDDLILARLSGILQVFIVVLSAYLSLWLVHGEIEILGFSLATIFAVLMILIVGYAFMKFVDTLLEWYEEEIAPKTDTKFDEEYMPLIRNIVRVTLLLITVLIALSYLGIDITPALAGLGIAGLAVGLALQDTLANFFAGLYLLADRPVRVGDYIRVGGEEGYVEEVGWRSTRLVTWDNKLIVLPNKVLAEQTIVNFFGPTEPTRHVIEVGVAYGSDLDQVERAIMSAIKETQKSDKNMDPSIEPFVRVDRFDDFAIVFKVGFSVKDYTKRFATASAVFKNIYKEFQKEGITIPFPTRTVYTVTQQKQEKSEGSEGKKKTRKR